MIDISLGGLIGAIVGTVIAAASYGMLVTLIEHWFKGRRGAMAEDRATLQRELALLRRTVLAIDILLFGGVGYWIGDRIGG